MSDKNIDVFFTQLLNEDFSQDTVKIASLFNDAFMSGSEVILSESDYLTFTSNIDTLKDKLSFLNDKVIVNETDGLAGVLSLIEKTSEYIVKKKKLLTGDFKIEDVLSFYRSMLSGIDALNEQLSKLEAKSLEETVQKETFKNNFNIFFFPFFNNEMRNIMHETMENAEDNSNFADVGKYMEENRESLIESNKKFVKDIKRTGDFIKLMKKVKEEYLYIFNKMRKDKENLNKFYKFAAEYMYASYLKLNTASKFIIRSHMFKKVEDKIEKVKKDIDEKTSMNKTDDNSSSED